MRRYQQLGNTGAITQIQIKEKEQAFKAAVSRLQRAKAGLNPSTAAVEIARDAIAQGKSTGESTLAALNQERESLLQRRIEIRSSINTAQKDLKQVETELQKTIIRATEAGTILKLELRNPGQVVRAGDTIAQIASAQAPLVVKAQIPSQDIGKVLVCKAKKVSDCEQGKAVLRVSAYPYPDYGTLTGAVRAITADAIKPENSSDAPYYEVSIEPEKLTLEKGGISYRIQPGMEVTADIISREETVLTFVLRKARLLTNL